MCIHNIEDRMRFRQTVHVMLRTKNFREQKKKHTEKIRLIFPLSRSHVLILNFTKVGRFAPSCGSVN